MNYPIKFSKDHLKVEIYETPSLMALRAAAFVTDHIARIISSKDFARIVIATGASQFSFYEELIKCDIDWKKVNVFHLDEYLGIHENHPASFRKYLKERILDIVKPADIHLLNGDSPDAEKEAATYAALLKDGGTDLACIGIGENGHIAFNDPPVADFNDEKLVKLVELDAACRKQQFGEGWFKSLDEVPTHAITLTIPAIMGASIISCVVPDQRKAEAVKNTLEGSIAESTPATVLRRHPDATLFLDSDSASLLSLEK